jgi:ribonuclease BN (tRNA processing enzyme)
MKLRFWGTRGSVPSPSDDTRELGGNTACVQLVDTNGNSLLVDCGTGIIEYASRGEGADTQSEFHILISHFHWDHILGFPFFHPIHKPGTVIHFYSPFPVGELNRNIGGLFDGTYSPLRELTNLNADVHFHQLPPEGGPINGFEVRFAPTKHTDTCYGYRIEGSQAVVGYITDHERQADPAINDGLLALVQGANTLVHEAQFTAEEYAQRIGWGHSTIEDAIENAIAAKAGKLLLFHHAPYHTDDFLRLHLRRLLRARDLSDQSLQEVALAHEHITYEL